MAQLQQERGNNTVMEQRLVESQNLEAGSLERPGAGLSGNKRIADRDTSSLDTGSNKQIRFSNVVGLSFDGDIRRTSPRWYVKECKIEINLNQMPKSQMQTLFKSTLRGAAAQWVRLLDTPTYTQLRGLLEERF